MMLTTLIMFTQFVIKVTNSFVGLYIFGVAEYYIILCEI